MIANYSQYQELLTQFYKRVVQSHTCNINLLGKYNKFVKDANIANRNQLRLTNRKSFDDNLSVSVKSRLSQNKSYRIKQMKSTKSENIYNSNNFNKVFIYGHLHHLITKQNVQAFNTINTKVKLNLQTKTKKKITKNTLMIQRFQQPSQIQRSNNQWKKIVQLQTNKSKVRWQKILGNILNKLNQQFIDIIIASMLTIDVTKQFKLQPTKQWWKGISSQLKISIMYLQLQDEKVNINIQVGNFKNRVIISYLKSDELYAIFEKVPEQVTITTSIKGIQNQQEFDQLTTVIKNINQNQSQVMSKQRKVQSCNYQQRKTNQDIVGVSNKNIEIVSARSISPTRSRKGGLNLCRKKGLRTVQLLMKQYRNNTYVLSRLDSLTNEKQSRDAKIRRLIQKKTSN